ncbi:uncharacterized protein DSM5745_01811 [Aspergillus mulundensis]|uniref:Uncharacterized protein n=1 Tax=Aspergillus mulundensis TaxID=1810919 RepID=A0A3D8SUR7_9EURO|nr:Uncharacterized protein DSM5745_01811 [Aspergillus mulundensis]RDW90036.1 Uncharacterized protein DSM5745_01811 [Aspergillus mulundensis]
MFASPSSSPSPSSSASSPSASPSPSHVAPRESYALFFRKSAQPEQTTAVLQVKDINTIDAFRTCRGIDLRIERHGDLTLSPTNTDSIGRVPPLYRFLLDPPSTSLTSTSTTKPGEIELALPARLDLGVSDVGIVGRQVTVTARGVDGEVLQMGSGIVGYD